MLVVILLYDQLLFRPLVAWADRFRFEQQAGVFPPRAWVLDVMRHSRLHGRFINLLGRLWRHPYQWPLLRPRAAAAAGASGAGGGWGDRLWTGFVLVFGAVALWRVGVFVFSSISLPDAAHALAAGLATLIRVIVLIAFATVIWVPIGVYVGTRPRLTQYAQPLAQFLAAFPANVLFPIAVSAIVAFKLSPDIWLSPLMILGTQWYILFNVIAGASSIPSEMRDIGANLQVRGWLWWKKIAIPAIFPYYVTGAITASGARGTRASSLRWRPGATPSCRRMGSAPISRRPPKPAIFPASCSGSP